MLHLYQNPLALEKWQRRKDYKNFILRAILTVVFSSSVFYLIVYLIFLSQGLNLGVSVAETVITRFSDNAAVGLTSRQQKKAIPVRLQIPALKVDAAIISKGLDGSGAVDMSEDPYVVAWFNLSSLPGEIGSTVIAGHYGWKENTPAVFDSLYKIRIGDVIQVEDRNGLTTTFVVRKMERYFPGSAAKEVFQSNDGKTHLNLITCEGDWNADSKSYSERLVVFADKE